MITEITEASRPRPGAMLAPQLVLGVVAVTVLIDRREARPMKDQLRSLAGRFICEAGAEVDGVSLDDLVRQGEKQMLQADEMSESAVK